MNDSKVQSVLDDNKALALLDRAKEIDVWGDRDEIVALGERLREVVPGWGRLNPVHAVAAAQYAAMTGANPMRGEIYAYTTYKGQLQIVDGYKLLVRWARRECNFYDKYVEIDAEEKQQMRLTEKDIALRCHILRDDARPMLKDLTGMGMPFEEAYEIVTSSAVGVVRHIGDMVINRKTINPPAGWSWEQVARKRALKNTLNIAYGMPSPQEIAKESWAVNDIVTIPTDWEDLSGATAGEREEEATINATARESKQRVAEMSDEEKKETLRKNVRILRGDPEDEFLVPPQEESMEAELEITQSALGRARSARDKVQSEPRTDSAPEISHSEAIELANELVASLQDLGADTEITDGKHCYKVQQIYDALDLGLPEWPLTANQVIAAIAHPARDRGEENIDNDDKVQPKQDGTQHEGDDNTNDD